MIKLVIKVPAECLVEVNEWALEVMSCELHDEMYQLGLVEFSFLVLDINHLNLLFGQIDESLIWVSIDNKHEVLFTNLQELFYVLNPFFGCLGG